MKIVANGVKTHYELIGQGPQLVFLHGWGGSWQSWYPIVGSLSNNFQLLLLDLPAFGQSATPAETWTSDDYSAWLAVIIDKLCLKPKMSLIGHSFGGKIAAVWAATHPNKINRLFLVAAAGLPDPLPYYRQWQKNILTWVPVNLKKIIPNNWRLKILNQTKTATDHFLSTPAQQQILAKSVSENISDKLTHIRVPTTLIWGDQDMETPLHQGRQFAQLIAGSDLVVLTGAGHFPFIDRPESVVQVITAELK